MEISFLSSNIATINKTSEFGYANGEEFKVDTNDNATYTILEAIMPNLTAPVASFSCSNKTLAGSLTLQNIYRSENRILIFSESTGFTSSIGKH
ncbi:MAG: hypothetical protein Q9M91_02760 [Candidatus Dojkabacteria bacterium]|nr:hypothetical protein [Candidatus Dojkabacteria bacterium]MDQ7020745.1 hypothetical protein [Candidatus Dojkabacteria bacterium]